MIKDVEFSENIENFRAPGFPSYDEIIEYEASGEGKVEKVKKMLLNTKRHTSP